MNEKMEVLIVSGISGAGKSSAANILEDMGYYCVDNLPVALVPKFAEFCISMRGKYERVALVTDIRGEDNFQPLFEALETIEELGCDSRILFIEAEVDVIIRRYKESRRRHPLSAEGESIEQGILREIERLAPVRNRAEIVIDTSGLPLKSLKDIIESRLSGLSKGISMVVTVQSFGFKYGMPAESDLVFDVRFLPNPYYEEELRELTGLNDAVRDYVFKFPQTTEFLEKLKPLLSFLLPQYVEEGKSSLTIAVGCTGGRHRSTALATDIAKFIEELGYQTVLTHRDINK